MNNVVFQGQTKSGLEITVRYTQSGDEVAMCDYVNKLSNEHTYVLLQGKQFTLKKETEYVKDQLEAIEKHTAVQLLVFTKDKLIGISSIDLGHDAKKHVGHFGISIDKEFRSLGAGKILMECVLDEAEKNLPDLKIVVLEAFSTNPTALKLYEQFGFVQFGLLPGGLLHEGTLVDEVCMFKKVRD